jgi:hypothetical protein
MLSHDLRALSIWFDACRESDFGFTTEGLTAFSRVLADAVAQAEALEEAAIGAAARGGVRDVSEEPRARDAANVVPFPHVARRVNDDLGGAA